MSVILIVFISISLTLFSIAQIWRLFINRKMEILQENNMQMLNQCNEVISSMIEQQQVLMDLLSEYEEDAPSIGFN